MIDDTAENGTVELEGKKYELSGDTHITLNKSLNFEGSKGTVIDGNNSSLYLNCVEKENIDTNGYMICRIGYELKNTGKHIVLKNITFTNINIVDWHEMDFIDCNFINATMTNYELNNTYEKSGFLNSTLEIKNPKGWLPDNFTPDYSKIMDCEFCESTIKSTNLILGTYIEVVGSSRFELINSIDISRCKFSKSNLGLTYYTVNISNCEFDSGSWEGLSSKISINSTTLENQSVDYLYSIVNAENSRFIDDNLTFRGGYFSPGCEINFDECEISSNNIKIDEGSHSGKSVLNMTESKLNNSYIDSKFADVIFNGSTVENTKMSLSYGMAVLENTTIINDENLTEIFKTYNVTFTIKDSYLVNGIGKYELDENGIAKNNLEIIIVDLKETYYVGDELIIKVIDSKGNPDEGEYVCVDDMSGDDPFYKYSDENGTVKYLLEKSGKINLTISAPRTFGSHAYIKTVKLNVKSTPINITAPSIKTTYGTKGTLKIRLTGANVNSTLNGFKLIIKVFTGKKYKTYEAVTKANGTATFKTPKNLNAGKHKVEITTKDLASKKVTITVNKAKTITKAPKVTGKFKQSKYFKVTVKDKATKKAVSNVNVKVKVYTGKKHVTKTVKTNSKGIAKLNTKSLKKGSHKVVISSANGNYKISAKSAIIIR